MSSAAPPSIGANGAKVVDEDDVDVDVVAAVGVGELWDNLKIAVWLNVARYVSNRCNMHPPLPGKCLDRRDQML